MEFFRWNSQVKFGVHDVSQRPIILIVSLLATLLASCADMGMKQHDGIDAELAPSKPSTAPVIPPRTTASEDKPITLGTDAAQRPKTKPELEAGTGMFYNPKAAS